MGIRNICWASGGSRGGFSHYPSWGSETSDDINIAIFPGDLITPHGDQKLTPFENPRDTRFHVSLPLMGIRNSGARSV